MKALVWVVFADLVFLASGYFVYQDLQWRLAYASSPHAATSGYLASFNYGLLVQFLTMRSTSVSLTSPPTLDWLQVIWVAAVFLNVWYFFWGRNSSSRASRGGVSSQRT